jgi:hypothetical protein
MAKPQNWCQVWHKSWCLALVCYRRSVKLSEMHKKKPRLSGLVYNIFWFASASINDDGADEPQPF